jgi:hypothetical protein
LARSELAVRARFLRKHRRESREMQPGQLARDPSKSNGKAAHALQPSNFNVPLSELGRMVSAKSDQRLAIGLLRQLRFMECSEDCIRHGLSAHGHATTHAVSRQHSSVRASGECSSTPYRMRRPSPYCGELRSHVAEHVRHLAAPGPRSAARRCRAAAALRSMPARRAVRLVRKATGPPPLKEASRAPGAATCRGCDQIRLLPVCRSPP